MKKPLRKRLILVLVPCAVAAAALVAFLSNDAEPSYKEKTLKQWMNIYCWPDNPTASDLVRRKSFLEGGAARKEEAADAVRQIGTNAIGTFLEWGNRDSRIVWKLKLHAALPTILQDWRPVDWWLVLQDRYRMDRALYGFSILGSNASSAVPELT